MNVSTDDFELPDDAMRVSVVSEADAHHALGSRCVEEEQARVRLAGLVSPKVYGLLTQSLEPNSHHAIRISGADEIAELYATLVKIRSADRAAVTLERSRESARRNPLVAHIALVDPSMLQGMRARVIRDEHSEPSSLILLPRNSASPEDVAAGIAAMTRLRRLYGDAVLERIEVDVLEFRATLSPAQSRRAAQILRAAMTGPTQSVPAFGAASMTSVRLSPVQP